MLEGGGNGGGAVVYPELGEDVDEVGLDGRLADAQRARNVFVRCPSGHGFEEIELAGAKVFFRHPGEAHEPSSHGGGEDGFPAGSDAYGANQFVSVGVFQHVAGGASIDSAADIRGSVIDREYEDMHLRVGGTDAGCGIDTVEFGHAQVHEHDVGPQPLHLHEGLRTIDGLTDDLKVGLASERTAQPIAH